MDRISDPPDGHPPNRHWLREIAIATWAVAKLGPLAYYFLRARRIANWTSRVDAVALARASYALPSNAVLVEIGSFLGSSAVLLAGARRLRGSGRVHCIDTFDVRIDTHGAPVLGAIVARNPASHREQFEANIRAAGLADWVEAHEALAQDAGRSWTSVVDLLYVDADPSYEVVAQIYDAWIGHVRPGGIIALPHTHHREYSEGPAGPMQLAAQKLRAPEFDEVWVADTVTFARKSR